jgi:deoxycytidine triphosphate deaminase
MKNIASVTTLTTLTNVQPDDIQPNACDVRLDKVFRILSTDFEITNDSKKHRGTEEILPDAEGYFTLLPGAYEIAMENIIHVGKGEAGWVITRSTLNRNGCFITSGLYDSGYHGIMAGVLHVTVGQARIKKGTRVGQYLCFDAEMLHFYNGSYGFDSTGKAKKDEEKYHTKKEV